MRAPLPYQIEPIRWALPRDRIALLMDKRLGKCTVAIRWAAARPRCRLVLVVCPLSAMMGWVDELTADNMPYVLCYQQDEDSVVSTIDTMEPPVSGRPIFFIINPQGLFTPSGRSGSKQPQPKPLATSPWDAIIWDESTSIRNPKAQTTRVAQAYLRAPYKAILSGDPAPEGPADLFEQFKWLQDGHFMGERNWWRWRDEHFNCLGYDWMIKPGHMQLIKDAEMARAFVLDRKTAGVGEIKTSERRLVDLPQEARRAYDEAERWMELPDPSAVSWKEAVVTITHLARLAGGYHPDFQVKKHPKMDALVELLEGEYRRQPVVILFRFNAEIAAAQAALSKLYPKPVVITGATPLPARKKICDDLKAGKVRHLLAQIKVVRFGLDLSTADTMIRYSMTPSYEDISQSADRIIHPAKRRPLHYIDLMSRDTVDEDLHDAYQDKRITARFFMKRFTELHNFRVQRKAVPA